MGDTARRPIASTLLVKKLLKSLAECSVDVDVTGLSKKFIFFQNDFESGQLSIDLNQKDTYSTWKTTRWKSDLARHRLRSSSSEGI